MEAHLVEIGGLDIAKVGCARDHRVNFRCWPSFLRHLHLLIRLLDIDNPTQWAEARDDPRWWPPRAASTAPQRDAEVASTGASNTPEPLVIPNRSGCVGSPPHIP